MIGGNPKHISVARQMFPKKTYNLQILVLRFATKLFANYSFR
jgi:hypothetical protein